MNGRHSRPGYTPSQPEPSSYSNWQTSEPPHVDRFSRPRAADDEENDPDLRAAIKESLREANAPKASAPALVESPVVETSGQSYTSSSYAAPTPTANAAARKRCYLYVSVGRGLSRYPAMNELYDKANGLRPTLAPSLDDTDNKESGYSI